MPLKVVPQRDRKLHRLVKKGEALTLRKGETLFEPGGSGTKVFLVRSGHLRLLRREGSGAHRTVAVAGPWELAGEEAAVSGVSRKTGAAAGEKTLVTLLNGEAVAQALRTAPKTLEAYLRAKEEELTLARCLGGTGRSRGGASRRLSALLLHLSARLGRSEEAGIRIPIRITHQALAELSGSHRSTVTTLLNDWIYEGLIRDEAGQIRILKKDGLARAGEG
jgi:CRP/FNR family cyclic AMP-dependent transcriptional regulator